MAQLPPGFVLEGQPAPQPAQPALPPGFVLEQPRKWSGAILPLSGDDQGNWSFDSDAGLVGVAKRIFTLPGDVATGQVDPMSDEGIGRAAEFAMGLSPLNPGIRAGDMAIPGVAKMLRRPNVVPPSERTLLKEGGAGLNAIRKMGVDYSANAVRNAVQGMTSELYEAGFREQTAPKTYSLLKEFDAAGDIATAADLMAARQAFRKAASDVGPDFKPTADAAAAMRVIAGLDRFLEEPVAGSVIAGPAEGVSTALRRANANYAAGKRSEKLTDLRFNAERDAQAANSGHNIDNTIRRQLAALLKKPEKTLPGFKQSEIAGLETTSRGTRGRNTLRHAGNYLGGGGGLGQSLLTAGGAVLGSLAGGPIGGLAGGVATGLTGTGIKALANTLTKRSLENVATATRKRSPLYEDMRRAAPLEAISPQKRAALMRMLLLEQSPQADMPMGQPDNEGLLRALIRQGSS